MPSEFIATDRHGNRWDVKLTVGRAQRADKSDFSDLTDRDFSILNPGQDLFQHIFARPALYTAIAYAIVRPEVPATFNLREASEEELQEAFADAWDGDTLRNLRDTLWGSFADFFPEQRTVLQKLLEQLQNASLRLTKEMEDLLPAAEQAINDQLTNGMEEIRRGLQPGGTSGG